VADSSARFWDRLIVDGVALLTIAFVLQGLWFAGGSAVSDWRPDLEPAVRRVSERFLALWVVGLGVGFIWGVKRAWEARDE
jgi:hypothetical protein